MAEQSSSFTGRSRRRTTTWAVKAGDITARVLITIGGIGTILAVATVCLFLVWVAAPLFTDSQIEPASTAVAEDSARDSDVLAAGLDEYGMLVWVLDRSGELRVLRLDTGEVLDRHSLVAGESPLTAAAYPPGGDFVALGYADGTVRLGQVSFETTYLDAEDVEAQVRNLEPGGAAALGRGLVERASTNQFRLQEISVTFSEPLESGSKAPVVQLDAADGSQGAAFVTLHGDGASYVSRVIERRNMLTRKVTRSVRSAPVPLPDHGAAAESDDPGRYVFVKMTQLANTAYFFSRDGGMLRFDIRDTEAVALIERGDVVADPEAELTQVAMLLGRSTLLVGDSRGDLAAWFRVRSEQAETTDGMMLVLGHPLPRLGTTAITAIGASARSRIFLAGNAAGEVGLYHVTSERRIGGGDVPDEQRIVEVAIAPKEDAVVALAGGSLHRWTVDLGYPEASLGTLFTPVWYEGYDEPDHVWQSSSGTDDAELKFGMMPLIFGTIKATIYSMIFGAPLALLAAVYTSEFLSRGARNRIKPTIELMASLPSVVLGFVAALVLAPIVEDHVPALLLSLITVPMTLLLAAHLWQLLPAKLMTRAAPYRIFAITAVLPLGGLLAIWISPAFEAALFEGDLKAWLDGQIGTGFGGLFYLMLPLSALASMLVTSRYVNSALRSVVANWSRRSVVMLSFVKFIAACAATVALAAAGAGVLGLMGLDPRGGMMSTYVQRNALIVGFIMGFAIIPIIYTIAEDALSSVPDHLRAASLGAGATPWQTATRVVLPVAVSGLFSALMIGLGRAVGETMIVLMAAGNTPIMDWNIFNGFRTLSANIAVELPEAVRGSTHYRTLFLAALLLFAMTFVVNTIAELVRLRFRKRNRQL